MKKISLLILLTFLLLSQTTVFAAGSVTACTWSGTGGLQPALTGGGIVTFTMDCTLTVPEILITGNVTIDGTSHIVILSGDDVNRVFNIQSDASLTLNHIVVTNGFTANNGGAIYNDGKLTLDQNSDVKASTARPSGGGIFTGSGTDLEILNGSRVMDNSAQNGGGLYNAGGTVVIDMATFSGNKAKYAGGAVVNSDATGSLEVTNSTFTQNSASDLSAATSGGAVHNQKGATALLQASTFQNNLAQSNDDDATGGAVNNDSGTVTIDQSTLSGNSATSVTAYWMPSGGAVSNNDIMSIIDNTVIDNNSAYFGGGVNNFGTLTIWDSTVSNNTGEHGGGILSRSGSLTVQNTEILSNQATAGAGVLISAGTGDISGNGTLIDSNISSTEVGGGVDNWGTLTIHDGVTISNNTAAAGGGVGNNVGGVLTIQNNVLISGNTATLRGGGVDTFKATTTLTNVIIEKNHSNDQGGGIANYASTITISGVNLRDNTALSGSALKQLDIDPPFPATTTITASCITNNGDMAVVYASGDSISAVGNWWGSVTGPGMAGLGDSISASVDASGYLTSPLLGCDRTTALISGTVYNDSNNNGVLDAGETGVPDVSLSVSGTSNRGVFNTTQPGLGDGTFSIEVRPGSYSLSETQPFGYVDGLDTLGSLGGVLANDTVSSIEVNKTDGTGYNFGEQLASVSIAAAASVIEGDNGTVNVSIPVTLSGPLTGQLFIGCSLMDGTANSQDYSANVACTGVIPAQATSTDLVLQNVVNGDLTFEADETFFVTLFAAAPVLVGEPHVATVTIVNDDVSINVTESDSTTSVIEGDVNGDTLQFVLMKQPSADVQITLSAGTGLITSVPDLTFTPQNWNTAQPVKVTATDNLNADGNRDALISYTISSQDNKYAQFVIPATTVHILDNDTPGVLITESNGSSLVVEGQPGDSYTVVLTSQPFTDVVIMLFFDTPTMMAMPNVLTFTPQNWNVPQTVTLTATQNNLIDGMVTPITHDITGDAVYDALVNPVVNVTVRDQLIQNGGFELAGVNARTALNWTGNAKLTLKDRRICDTKAVKYSFEGKCAFQFSSTVALPRLINQTILNPGNATTGDLLTLTFFAKGKGVTVGAQARVQVTYAVSAGQKKMLTIRTGSFGYKKVTGNLTLNATDTITKVVVVFETRRSVGILHIDKVTLVYIP